MRDVAVNSAPVEKAIPSSQDKALADPAALANEVLPPYPFLSSLHKKFAVA